MTPVDFLNLAGLTLITVGSICAARSAPTPTYGPNGSVSLTGSGMQGEEGKQNRIEMHRRQKRFPQFLWLIAAGALLQAAAIVLAPYLKTVA